MKNSLLIVTLLAGILTCGSRAMAEFKVAVVDMEAVMEASPEVSNLKEVMQERDKEFEAEKQAMIEKLQQIREDFEAARQEARNEALSQKGKRDKIQEAEEKLAELKQQQERMQETAMQRRNQIQEQKVRAHRRIIGELRKKIGEYAKGKGYQLVLNASGISVDGVEVVIYANSAIDITDEVVKKVIKANE